MKRFLCLGALLLLLADAKAMVITSGSKVIIEYPVHEDLYISAGTVIIRAPIYGSLVVAGGTVTVNDSVRNDILIVGGELSFYGYVGGTIRCAGGRLKVGTNITHDLVAVGGTLMIEKRDTINGDLLAAAGNITVDGVIAGNSHINASSFILNGSTIGSVDCKAETVEINGWMQGPATLAATGSITISEHAMSTQDFHYWTPDRKIATGINTNIGHPVYDPSLEITSGRWYLSGARSVTGFIWYLGMALVMLFLLQYLFPASFRKAGGNAFERPGRSFLAGLAYFIGIPLITLICFVTVIGIPIGVMLALLYIATVVFSGLITALAAAHWLNDRMEGNWTPARIVFVALGLLIVLRLIAATPFMGLPIFCILGSIAMGALLLNIRWKKTKATIVNLKTSDHEHQNENQSR